jgi:threonyl-tRNA synthetase
MSKFYKVLLYAPEGDLLWEGSYDEREQCLIHIKSEAVRATVAWVCSSKKIKHKITGKEIYDVANKLGFLSAKGCEKGFYNVLPNGMLLNQIMESFNREHLRCLKAERINFPLIFNGAEPRMAELTQSYEMQDRIFNVDSETGTGKLSYAADPGLLSWLSDSVLDQQSLPYCIYTPSPVFRKWRSGELGFMNNYNQYDLFDTHILVDPKTALSEYHQCVQLNSEGMRFWGGEEWFHLLETDKASLEKLGVIGPDIARRANQYTLFLIAEKQPRYYCLKSGFMTNAGRKATMLYNLQLDNVNGERFNIKASGNSFISIIHATVAGSWSNILPMFIGRALSGLSPQALPFLIDPVQVTLLPVMEKHYQEADKICQFLFSKGIRSAVDTSPDSLSKRIKHLIANWHEHYVVIGDRELQGNEPDIESWNTKTKLPLSQFLNKNKERIERCMPQETHVRRILKFVPNYHTI